jgi:hypothetical protein
MLASQGLRDAFFGAGALGNINGNAGAFFGGSGSANRNVVINAMVNNAVGVAIPAAGTAVRNEVDALLTRIPSLNNQATVSQATIAVCTAVLGSAAVTLQ